MKRNNRKLRRRVVGLMLLAFMVFALLDTNQRSASADAAEQVIFSGVGFADTGDWTGPVGFWIWCIDEGNGPYAEDNECKGAMYVYSQAITVHVDGDVTELGDDTYRMDVLSQKAGVLSATLHNLSDDSGPNNVVEFEVTTAAGTASGTSDNAVVRVTGPGD